MCACGHEAVKRLFVNYRYPRAGFLAEAMDPWYVRGGGWSIWTCGNPLCEPDALLAVREDIIDHSLTCFPWVAGWQMAAIELYVSLEPGAVMRTLGGETA
jgi:hypothetical protein